MPGIRFRSGSGSLVKKSSLRETGLIDFRPVFFIYFFVLPKDAYFLQYPFSIAPLYYAPLTGRQTGRRLSLLPISIKQLIFFKLVITLRMQGKIPEAKEIHKGMQLNLTTDYAIRLILFLAERNCTVRSKEISEHMKIPYTIVTKIVLTLKKAGYVSTQSGVVGGVSLVKQPSEITLYDLIRLMEKGVKINRCLEEDHYCSRDAADDCPVHRFFTSLQDEIERRLRSTTMEDLLQHPK